MGYRQAVRQWTLTPSYVGSNPTIPVWKLVNPFKTMYSIFIKDKA